MKKFYFFILLIFFSFSNNSTIKKYNIDDLFFNQIDLTDRTACICFKLDDYLSKDSTFYVYAQTDNSYARMNKTIHYNFLESCDSKDTCDDIYLNNYLENNDRTIDIDGFAGFNYEYKFIVNDENKKAILIQYNDFTGEEFTLTYSAFKQKSGLIVIIVLIGLLMICNVVALICIYKEKKDEYNEEDNDSFDD